MLSVAEESETNNVTPDIIAVGSECCSIASDASDVTVVQSRSNQNMPEDDAVNVVNMSDVNMVESDSNHNELPVITQMAEEQKHRVV